MRCRCPPAPGNYSISRSTDTEADGGTIDVQCCTGPPMVNSDGTPYMEYEVRNVVNNRITSDTLYLFQINPDNSFASTVLSSTTQNEALFPGPIISDGQGGILATWTISPSYPPVPQYPYQAVDVVSGVVGMPYNLPFSPTTVRFGQSPTIVLGENGIAFAAGPSTTTDGTSTAVDQISSFNVSSGAPNWSYQGTSGNTLSLIMATAGNGLVAKTTDQSGNDTVLTFDPIGVPQSQVLRSFASFGAEPLTDPQQSGTSSIDYYANGWYLGFKGGSTVAVSGHLNLDALAPATRPKGDAQHNGTTDPGLVLVATQDCHLTVRSVSNGHLIYGRFPIYSLRLPGNLRQTPQCDKLKPATTQNQCYSVFEYVPENHENCTIAGEKGVSPCFYRDGTNNPYNEFDDQISTLDLGSFDKTQYFDYGLPDQTRMWYVRRIYRTLVDGSLQPKQPTAICAFCYNTNYLHADDQADPLIDGNPDPWLAPWDGTKASCKYKGGIYF